MLNQKILDALLSVNEEEQEILDGRKDIDRSIYMEGKTNTVNSSLLLGKGKLITIHCSDHLLHWNKYSGKYSGTVLNMGSNERYRHESSHCLYHMHGSIYGTCRTGLCIHEVRRF